MSAHAYPLQWPDGWPRTPPVKQGRSRFTTTFDRARRQLLDELRMLGATDVVLSTDVPLRRDGQPYSDMARRRIDDPGAAVYFTLRGKRLVMARDEFWTPWENIRSLGLAIEHLRGLERHGGATMMERAFTGFTALPPPAAARPAKRPWREVLEFAPADAPSRDEVERRFKRLAMIYHPDRGGTAREMADLNAARAEALEEIGS